MGGVFGRKEKVDNAAEAMQLAYALGKPGRMGPVRRVERGDQRQNGALEQHNFLNCPVLRMHQLPAMELTVIDSAQSPAGAGEPAVPSLAPALCNAIAAAMMGQRITTLLLVKSGVTFAPLGRNHSLHHGTTRMHFWTRLLLSKQRFALTFAFCAVFTAQACAVTADSTVRIIPLDAKAWAGSSVNVLANVRQTLFTEGVFQYAGYHGADGMLMLAKRRIGEDQ